MNLEPSAGFQTDGPQYKHQNVVLVIMRIPQKRSRVFRKNPTGDCQMIMGALNEGFDTDCFAIPPTRSILPYLETPRLTPSTLSFEKPEALGPYTHTSASELVSKLLVSPLTTPIVVPYRIPYIPPFKEFRL